MRWGKQATSSIVLGLASGLGLLAFLYPFLLPLVNRRLDAQRSMVVPLLFALLAVTCLAIVLAEIQGRTPGPGRARLVALLGVLVAFDAALRLVPSLLGASPIFLLIILTGYCFGAGFGFLMGSLTLLLSALITGGMGPWLPYQMLAAGWVGMTAGWIPRLRGWWELATLAVFGAVWGFLFGALMNLWFWPFAAPGLDQPVGLYWHPSMSAEETLHTYARFYLATSLVFDGTRALGNATLVLLFGRPVIAVLDRYRERCTWQPWMPLGTPPPMEREPGR
jgi:energy-coupling factor transport system substrate-specific component